jgi:Uncharacterized protein conserved in bacteria (DUF2188)
MSEKKIYHIIVSTIGGWDLMEEHSTNIIMHYRTKKDLVDQAVDFCKGQNSELVIHDRSGKVEDRRRYGTDLKPPTELFDI